MAEVWPDVLKPTSVGFWMEHQSRSGGVSLSGQEQIVASLAGRWRARLVLPIRKKEQVLAIRAFMAALDGRAGTVVVPAFDGKRANWPLDQWGRVLHPGFTREKGVEDTVYESPEIPAESDIDAVVNNAVPAGGTEIGIKVNQGEPLQPGQYFGLVDRLYLISAIIATAAGNVQRVAFRPRLRKRAQPGQNVRLQRPQCVMRLASDDQGLRELQLLRFADVTLEFTEVL